MKTLLIIISLILSMSVQAQKVNYKRQTTDLTTGKIVTKDVTIEWNQHIKTIDSLKLALNKDTARIDTTGFSSLPVEIYALIGDTSYNRRIYFNSKTINATNPASIEFIYRIKMNDTKIREIHLYEE